MYVEWKAPEEVTRPYPVVLMHGGGRTRPRVRMAGWLRIVVSTW